MITIAHMTSLEDAYRGMDLLREHAIPPALSQDGELLAICVDDDFAPHAKQIFSKHEIGMRAKIAAGAESGPISFLTEDENT